MMILTAVADMRQQRFVMSLLFELTELDELPISFHASLWNAAIDYVTVCSDGRVVFHFKDGKGITELQ